MSALLVVASHKPFEKKLHSPYTLVQAGTALHEPIEGMLHDNEGENISDKNPYYSELTALYYAWKNLDYSHLGLVHYRRWFKGELEKDFPVLSGVELADLISKHEILVPKKRHYVIESLYDHYSHTHYQKDLDTTREVLQELYPEMVKSFDRIMKRRSAHMFNMFVMSKEKADQYLSFLFTVLQALESRIDLESYDPFQKRALGRISELLLDAWLDHTGYDYKEIPLYHSEGEDWPKKIRTFLLSKWKNETYKQSFKGKK